MDMSSLRSQTLEIPAASLVLLSSVAAGMVGLLVGRLWTPRAGLRTAGRRAGRSESETSGRRPKWRSITEVEEQLRVRDAELEGMRRNYELDTGLLKEEIRRLTESLADLEAGRTSCSTEGPTSSSSGEDLETPGGRQSRRIEFSSLDDLVGRSLRDPDRI